MQEYDRSLDFRYYALAAILSFVAILHVSDSPLASRWAYAIGGGLLWVAVVTAAIMVARSRICIIPEGIEFLDAFGHLHSMKWCDVDHMYVCRDRGVTQVHVRSRDGRLLNLRHVVEVESLVDALRAGAELQRPQQGFGSVTYRK